MIYDPKNPYDQEKAKTKLQWYFDKGKVFRMEEVKQKRSLNQNAYLHLLCGHYAIETGNTIEWVKQKYFKELCNPEIFVIEKDDPYLGKTKNIRSSADLDSGELTKAIDKFIEWCEQDCGVFMPRPIDLQFLNSIDYEIQKNKNWL